MKNFERCIIFSGRNHEKILIACAILQNHKRVEQPNDPDLEKVDVELQAMINLEPSNYEREDKDEENDEKLVHVNFTNVDNQIKIIRTTNGWTQFRNALAQAMFAE